MIDPEKFGIEAGDKIRITIEGVVEKTDLYDHWPYRVNGFGIGQIPTDFTIEPTVEILRKAVPKWHSAQVIMADTRFCREILVRRAGVEEGLPWQGTNGHTEDRWFDHEDLLHVEVLVQ